MIIRSLRVQNFRSLRDAELRGEPLTALVGPNGTGKSSFLRALELFYSTNPRYSEQDFYAGDTNERIRIRVTFGDLSTEERESLASHLQGDLLTVEKELSWPPGRQSRGLFGWTEQNPEFAAVREAMPAAARKTEYERLRNKAKYPDLPKWSNQEAALQALAEWEVAHPEACKWERDDGQFFGFKEVGQYRLEEHTRFILIPAVCDAATEAAEAKGSAIFEIMELVVRSRLAQREDIGKLREETQRRYEEIVDPGKVPELATLQTDLTSTLQTFVPDASVLLTWSKSQQVDLPMPKAEVQLLEEERGYPCPVDRTGHGVQRAFILTLLQHLAVAEAPIGNASLQGESPAPEERAPETVAPAQSRPMPHLIVAIEEPELYQHPNRQRYMAQVLLSLAAGRIKGVADRTQVIYSTHSPLFVGVDRFHQVRLLRKEARDSGRPQATSVRSTSLDHVAHVIELADDKPKGSYSGKTLEPRLQTLMTPWMNEGFFADLVVLVEGEEDRAAITAYARVAGYEFEREGISVIPCMGKNNIDKPYVIFTSLGIPVYAVWDGDSGDKEARPEENHRLMRLFGLPPEDWPEFVRANCACFRTTLGETFCREIGADCYDSLLEECKAAFDLGKRRDAEKNPFVVYEIIQKARSASRTSPTLESVVQQIVSLHRASRGSEVQNGSPLGV